MVSGINASKKTLGLGIVGLRHQHARWYHALWDALAEDYRVVAAAEADEPFLREELGFFGCEGVTDYRRLLERADIDAVILWLPHAEMPAAVAAAAAAGKHVIVEKPCCADLAGAEAIVETARRHPDIRISAPYCWRTHLASLEIRRTVRSGAIGEITALEARLNAGGAYRYVRDHQDWMLDSAQGGGPLWNLGVHWIDFFRWLSGAEVIEAAGMLTPPRGEPARGIEDAGKALLRLDNGATAMLEASYEITDAYPGKRDIALTIRGTRGAIAWQPAWKGTTDEIQLVSNETPGEAPSEAQSQAAQNSCASPGSETETAATEGDGGASGGNCRTVRIESPAIAGYCGHMAWSWLKDFASCVREGRQPQVAPADILAAVKVADAVYRSARSGRVEPVI